MLVECPCANRRKIVLKRDFPVGEDIFTEDVPATKCVTCGQEYADFGPCYAARQKIALKLLGRETISGPAFRFIHETAALGFVLAAPDLEATPEDIRAWRAGTKSIPQAARERLRYVVESMQVVPLDEAKFPTPEQLVAEGRGRLSETEAGLLLLRHLMAQGRIERAGTDGPVLIDARSLKNVMEGRYVVLSETGDKLPNGIAYVYDGTDLKECERMARERVQKFQVMHVVQIVQTWTV